jgi:dUTP pyrophosphatase
MIVYFAEPIDQDQANYVEIEFRTTMQNHLLRTGASVYRPATAWNLASIDRHTSAVAEKVNRTALAEADLLVARLPEGTASVGVPMEIEYATRVLGIPAIVVGVGGVALQANPMVWLVDGRNIGKFDRMYEMVAREKANDVKPLYHVGSLNPRSYPGDAGIDLVANADTVIPAHGTARVPTGNHFQFPQGVWGWIVARSSTFETYGVQILPGIIDEGYTGELFANALNESDQPRLIKAGSRLCQIILFENKTAQYAPIQVDKIEERDRGSNGFGSTGANGHFLSNGPDSIKVMTGEIS